MNNGLCLDCGNPHGKSRHPGTAGASYCQECIRKRKRERNRLYHLRLKGVTVPKPKPRVFIKAEKPKEKKVEVRLAKAFNCIDCGQEFYKRGGSSPRCEDCRDKKWILDHPRFLPIQRPPPKVESVLLFKAVCEVCEVSLKRREFGICEKCKEDPKYNPSK